jgi:hypothetical protein
MEKKIRIEPLLECIWQQPPPKQHKIIMSIKYTTDSIKPDYEMRRKEGRR